MVIEDVCQVGEVDLSPGLPHFYNITCIFIHPLAFVLFHRFMALSTSAVNSSISSVSALDFIVLSGVGTVWVQSDLYKSLDFLLCLT